MCLWSKLRNWTSAEAAIWKKLAQRVERVPARRAPRSRHEPYRKGRRHDVLRRLPFSLQLGQRQGPRGCPRQPCTEGGLLGGESSPLEFPPRGTSVAVCTITGRKHVSHDRMPGSGHQGPWTLCARSLPLFSHTTARQLSPGCPTSIVMVCSKTHSCLLN